MLPLRDNIPTSRTAYVTYALIAANVLVYFFWQRGGFSLGDPSNLHYHCQLHGVGGGAAGDHAPARRRRCRRSAGPTTRTRT